MTPEEIWIAEETRQAQEKANQQLATLSPQQQAKQLLDIYRAMNGGALPPGMTPEQAQMIDMGLDAGAGLAANPAMQLLIQQIGANRLQTGQNFAAARDLVGQRYDQTTGDITQDASAYLADLAGKMGLTPEQLSSDPTINQYNQTISSMNESADQNQQTDMAWFDKMAQTYDQQQAALLASLQAQAALPVDTSGGGGGGGGRGGFRRGGRGGGGSGDGMWRDPKTTDTQTEAADVDSARNFPGYIEDVLARFDDPASIEAANRMLDAYGGQPYPVSKGLAATEIPNAEALQEQMLAQYAQRRQYYDTLPLRAATSDQRANQIVADVTKNIPFNQDGTRTLPPDRFGGESPRQLMDPNQREQYNNEVASILLQGLAGALDQRASQPNVPYGQTSGGMEARLLPSNPGNSRSAEIDRAYADYLRNEALRGVETADRNRLAVAQDQATTDNPFTFKGWEGYVPQPDREEYDRNNWFLDIARNVLDVSRQYNPNREWNVTDMSMSDSSSTKTTQNSTNPWAQLFDNNNTNYAPAAETPSVEELVGPINPVGPAAGFGESRGLGNLSDAAIRTMARRNEMLAQAAERDKLVPRTGSWQAFNGPSRPEPVRRTDVRVNKAKVNPARPTPPPVATTPPVNGIRRRPSPTPPVKKKEKKKSTSGWNAFRR